MEKPVKSTVKKTIAVMFSVILFAETILSAIPADVSAGEFVTSSVITGFSQLPNDVKEQVVEAGTEKKDLNLPTELEVSVEQTVYRESVVSSVNEVKVFTETEDRDTEPVSENADTETVSSEEGDAGEQSAEEEEQSLEEQSDTEEEEILEESEESEWESISEIRTETINVGEWKCDKEYNPNESGAYTFTPELSLPEGYEVQEGIALPEINVTVLSYKTLPDKIKDQETISLDSGIYVVDGDKIIQGILEVKENARVIIRGKNGGKLNIKNPSQNINGMIRVNHESKLTLENITIESEDVTRVYSLIYNKGTMICNNVTVQNVAMNYSGSGGNIIWNSGKLNMNHSTIQNCRAKANIIINSPAVSSEAYFEFNDSTIQECESTYYSSTYPIKNDGIFEIKSGQILCGLDSDIGKVIMRGGKITKIQLCYGRGISLVEYYGGNIEKINLEKSITHISDRGRYTDELSPYIVFHAPLENNINMDCKKYWAWEGDIVGRGTDSYQLTEEDYNKIEVKTNNRNLKARFDKNNNYIILGDANKSDIVNSYTVKFNLNGAEGEIPDQKIESGEKIKEPSVDNPTGRIFSGWYTEEDCISAWNFDNSVTGDMTLYAKWEFETYEVAFNLNGAAGEAPEAQTVEYNGKAAEPEAPDWEGHTFGGWYTEEECTNGKEWNFESDKVTEDIILYAKWTTKTYEVTFDLNGAAGEAPEVQTVEYNGKAAEPEEPEWEGHTFAGWYTEEECTNAWNFADDTVVEDMTLYAKWTTKTFEVTFNLNGGTGNVPEKQQVVYGGLVTMPGSDPTWKKHEFTGWYKNEDCIDKWNFETDTVTDDRVIYAGWNPMPEKYKVVFYQYQIKGETDVIDVISSDSVTENNKIAEPEEPEREKYSFAGWYTDKECTEKYDFNTHVTSESGLIDRENPESGYDGTITLYALWNPLLETYNVIFDLNYMENGVEKTTASTVKENEAVNEPEQPVRTGYTFGGWYTDKECTNAWNFAGLVTENITLYAKWTLISDSGSSSGGDSGSTRKGTVTVAVEKDASALETRFVTPDSEVADTVLTQADRNLLENGTDIKIVLEVKDADSTVSSADRELVRSVLNNYTVGKYLDISLYRIAGTDRKQIHETDRKMRIVLTIPEELKNIGNRKAESFTIIRVHNGEAENIPDMDNDENTITVDTDRFSTYAIAYRLPAGGENSTGNTDINNPGTEDPGIEEPGIEEPGSSDSGVKISHNAAKNEGKHTEKTGKTDQESMNRNMTKSPAPAGREPSTGDTTHLELYAIIIMIAGCFYLYLCFMDNSNGMNEEKKNKLVTSIATWAKQGGQGRKLLGIVAFFFLLLYYDAVGKKIAMKREEVYV